MKKELVLAMVLLASAMLLAVTPAAAYEEEIPGDVDENGELTKEELSTTICSYMLDEGTYTLDDVGDAAWVYAYWDGKPMTVVDNSDREVTFYRPIERIVSTFPSLSRTIVEVDGADRLVGVSQYVAARWSKALLYLRVYPELKELPEVGCFRAPNMEQMVLLKPDAIFVATYSGGFGASQIQEQTGIPVVAVSGSYPYEGKGGAFDGYRVVGKVLGKEERAEELIACVNEEFDKVRAVTSEIPDDERVRVYYCSELTKPRSDFDPIEIAGGIDVAKESGYGWSLPTTKEQVIEWNPDIILIHSTGKSHTFSIEDVLSDPDLQSINAVKNGTVYYAQTGYVGLVVAIGMTQVPYMAKLFYPEKFEELDVEETGNRILEKYYGADGLYTYLQESRDFYKWE